MRLRPKRPCSRSRPGGRRHTRSGPTRNLDTYTDLCQAAIYGPAHGGASCPRRRPPCPIFPSQLSESAAQHRDYSAAQMSGHRFRCRRNGRAPSWALRVSLCSPRQRTPKQIPHTPPGRRPSRRRRSVFPAILVGAQGRGLDPGWKPCRNQAKFQARAEPDRRPTVPEIIDSDPFWQRSMHSRTAASSMSGPRVSDPFWWHTVKIREPQKQHCFTILETSIRCHCFVWHPSHRQQAISTMTKSHKLWTTTTRPLLGAPSGGPSRGSRLRRIDE